VPHVWGDGHGKFSTRGANSAATVRGTRWLVEERCTGTFTRVSRGIVAVRDFARHKTVSVKAGRTYLARPKAR
jgi:ferric-dicitrate binding protein FerR (iron transport regulator)